MKEPVSPSKSHLLDLINSLYATRAYTQLTKELLACLQVFVPFDAAALLEIDRGRYEVTPGVCAGRDAGLIEDYLGRHAALDPCLLDSCCPTRLNQTNSLSPLLATPAWSQTKVADIRSAFQFEHAVNVIAGWRDQPIALLRLHRRASSPDFSAQEMELIDTIAPHIATSAVLHKSADTQSMEPDIGLLALTSDDQLVYGNGVAQYVMSQLDPDTIRALAIARAIWRSEDAGVFRLRILPMTSRSLLSWLDLQDLGGAHERPRGRDSGVTILVIEPIQRRHALASRLVHSRLSRREVQVALCVMRGLSNADIATELRIDEKTVKDHLRRIYGKIEVRSRTAMISKVLGLEAELTPMTELASKARL
ncbi:helix-turn-helix transcriptional regulator [Thiocystis violacea]|uniref:helix-turn-helix transcriptional regulator n=1 Tax=Thiocystis violacea TaxID=13725 RepID=UPI0019055638|nr:helix-turn-helix transcriptional regulator [Thiocystis violacea]MBK1723787.1 hypothetical protein [Thiocystis violacea]